MRVVVSGFFVALACLLWADDSLQAASSEVETPRCIATEAITEDVDVAYQVAALKRIIALYDSSTSASQERVDEGSAEIVRLIIEAPSPSTAGMIFDLAKAYLPQFRYREGAPSAYADAVLQGLNPVDGPDDPLAYATIDLYLSLLGFTREGTVARGDAPLAELAERIRTAPICDTRRFLLLLAILKKRAHTGGAPERRDPALVRSLTDDLNTIQARLPDVGTDGRLWRLIALSEYITFAVWAEWFLLAEDILRWMMAMADELPQRHPLTDDQKEQLRLTEEYATALFYQQHIKVICPRRDVDIAPWCPDKPALPPRWHPNR